jgi:hypothetical protein
MDPRERGLHFDLEGTSMSASRIGLVLGLVFAVTLAVVVGKRMSAEAMAVVVGVVCGVAAGIPTAVLLLVVMFRRERQQSEESVRQTQARNCPPVVVIQGGAPQALHPGMHAGYWPSSSPGPSVQRQFHVLGDDLLNDVRY